MKFRSKNEEDFYKILAEILPGAVIQHDYPVGGKLQVDFFIDSPCRIGFEVDGAQHFGFNSRFHNTKEDFDEQQDRDARKALFCARKGIALVRVDARKKIKKADVKKAVDEAIKASADIERPKKVLKEVTEWEKAAKEARRAYRAEQYKKAKVYRKR